MATVTSTIASVTIADADKALTALETAFESEKSKIIAVVQQHINNHQAQAAAHAAEVSAAQAILAKALPPAQAAPSAIQAAAIVLTAPGSVQKALGWLGTNWRWAVVASAAGVLGVAQHGWHVL